ncbi:MAG: PIN domain-containing protein [Anaerolineae bacterium]|nr:PIN domain-containing protein [Anaerolineae bacterium]
MVNALLDTSILVDLLRGYPSAVNWIATQSDLGVSEIVAYELIEGADNRRELERALVQFGHFELVEHPASDLQWARQQLTQYWLSHHIDAFDCLIAALAYRLQLPLYTINIPDFTPLIGSLATRPY